MRVFLDNPLDLANELPVYSQQELNIMSRFKRSGKELIMEFIYSRDGWIPTWRMSREDIGSLIQRDSIDISFIVRVREGSILKRVEKRGKETVTKLYCVTRWGLLDVLYDYERGIYVLNTGIKLESR